MARGGVIGKLVLVERLRPAAHFQSCSVASPSVRIVHTVEIALRACFGQKVSDDRVLALLREMLETGGYGQGQLDSEKTNIPDDRHLYWYVHTRPTNLGSLSAIETRTRR